MLFRPGRLHSLFMVLGLFPGLLFANDVVTVAVASNFAGTAANLVTAFTEETGVEIRLSPGSTGKLYAQILHGAPYDIFLAADEQRPLLLEQGGHSVRGSRATYAMGGLVLWSRDERLRGKDCHAVLRQGNYDHLALANPETAPYGAAARQFLVAEKLWESVSPNAVYGENISQTMQFVASGNANLGFIAQAQTTILGLPAATCSWPVPETRHAPIRQQLVLLARARDNQEARRFLEFLKTPRAAEIMRQHGYRVLDR
jgi:molybdate transport system substrate-binding protein